MTAATNLHAMTPAAIMTDKVTTASAVGAIATPIWLPSLADVSQGCATAAPILGVLWLVLQFALKLRDEWRGRSR